MHSSYTAEGIVLKRSNFNEADKILTVFAKKHGKIKVIAKGVRKIKSRRGPHIELFNHVKIFLHKGKSFDIVTETEAIETFENLKKDLKKIAAAYYIAEIVDKLCPERQEHDDILFELIKVLHNISYTKDNDLTRLIDDFSLIIITNLGYLPQGHTIRLDLKSYIEEIIENKLKTPQLLARLK